MQPQGVAHRMATARFYYRDSEAPVPNRPLRLVVVAFVEHDDPARGPCVLMEQRSDCGQWCLIGGAVDLEQSLEDALRAEVHEETGLTIASYTLFGHFSDPSMIAHYPDGAIYRAISFAYRCQVDDLSGLACSPESLDLRFFTHEELRSLDIIPTVRHVVDRYLADRTALALD
jgi:8-oxo-dGTP pyrophosphatase MutT (NUDIX family)